MCGTPRVRVDYRDTAAVVSIIPSLFKQRSKLLEILHTDNNGVTTSHKNDANVPPGHFYTIEKDGTVLGNVSFQNGPVGEVGVNGITNEALIAIVIHRTKILNGMFPSSYNELALHSLCGALNAFEARTKDRVKRRVEGQNKV